MAAWIWVVIAIAVVVVVALVVAGARRQRTATLRDRFGPEYDRAVDNSEDRRAAEAELRAREKQRAQFDVRPLPEATRLSFANEWRGLQEQFVDEPAQAAGAADTLITRVMEARGYPMKDFDTQVDLVSVDHPNTVENYRFAHAVQQRAQTQQASTEDLREALLRYRSLFDELLRPEGNGSAEGSGTAEGSGAASAIDDEERPAAYDRVPADLDAQVPAASATGPADDPELGERDMADPAASGPDYENQRIGRRDV
jgi:hypothetical protein